MAVLGVMTVIGLYAVGAWRIEMIRQAPQTAFCSIGHCVPANSTFSALR
ncbi:hypothetical protein [Pseudomonas sp. v388]|nr:hypothetical protein [Pseudomonas sp. v388]